MAQHVILLKMKLFALVQGVTVEKNAVCCQTVYLHVHVEYTSNMIVYNGCTSYKCMCAMYIPISFTVNA